MLKRLLDKLFPKVCGEYRAHKYMYVKRIRGIPADPKDIYECLRCGLVKIEDPKVYKK